MSEKEQLQEVEDVLEKQEDVFTEEAEPTIEAETEAQMDDEVIPPEEERTEETTEELLPEEDEELLQELDVDYSEEERKLFWNINSVPMFKSSNLIFTGVCFVVALVFLIIGKLPTLAIAFFVVGIVWSGVPVLIYYIRYSRYIRKTASIWKKKWHMEIWDGHILMQDTTDKEHKEWIDYDDVYRLINMNNRVYVVAGTKRMAILQKGHVSQDIINAVLELDVPIQTEPRT